MTAKPGITVGAPAATAIASAPGGRVWAKTGTFAASAVASAPAPTVIIGSALAYEAVKMFVAYPPTPERGDHFTPRHDLISGGADVLLTVGALYVAARTFRLSD
jgi:hypothetical protein